MSAKSLLIVGATYVLTVMAKSDVDEAIVQEQRTRLWNQYPDSNGKYIVPYQFSNSSYKSSERCPIVAAMETIAANTCIEFRPRMGEEDYIEFINGISMGCFSKHTGRVAGKNAVYLESDEETSCVGGYAMMPLLACLGLYGEHKRVDRDKYIKVHLENLADPQDESIFAIENSTKKYASVPYDYLSIMHYGKDAFARARTITIETLDPAFQDIIGDIKEEPTARDYEKINVLYQCKQP
ncbi:unnamed protein product [Cylicocyclus nassatus]|uniref:Metalloendopeptidase n=1 Tax=Cylicocyclus nassatus TaxID=53992 RepID=A0AA36DLL3_CYLNA|nr:unnamed protein product [Cylicocyclus nassatus]